jgi:hypothetical protein
MKFPIGAMSVGDILDRGLKVLLSRLPTFYLISLIALTPVILFQLAWPLVQESTDEAVQFGGPPSAAALGAEIGGSLGVLILILILSQISNAAILHIIAQEFIDQRVGIGSAFRFAFHRFGRLLLASILQGLTIGLGFILCIAPGIIFWVWYMFVAQVVVVEGFKGEKAMSRSKELTAGYRGRVFGILLLCIAIGVILQMAVGLLQRFLPTQELVRTTSGFVSLINYRNYAVNVILGQLVNILVQTYIAVCITLLYFDLRIRKEGFDLELAAKHQSSVAP